MYIQKTDFSPNSLKFKLREHAKKVSDDFEDYFIHFSEDTIVKGRSLNHSKYTSFNRNPWIAGWSGDDTHSGFVIWQRPPYSLQPFSNNCANGGGVSFYMPEKFDQVELI